MYIGLPTPCPDIGFHTIAFKMPLSLIETESTLANIQIYTRKREEGKEREI
jgi:hypothetical protein